MDRFENTFDKADLREWKRAITTQAHGFNVAACVYLRRLFENILWEARDQVENGVHKGNPWPEFDNARMSEKVSLVASELPRFIVEHPELYGILSKGVHQLSEDECGKELPVLQQCMTLIAQQREKVRADQKSEVETKKLLAEAASRLGKQ